jgi:glycosyltransferase involved in cell wall biosynthesis
MHIGILTNYHLEQVGGAEEALDRLAGHWHDTGHRVTLIAPPASRPSALRVWQPQYQVVPVPVPWSSRFGLGRYVRWLQWVDRLAPLDLMVGSDAYWPGHVTHRFWQATGTPYVLYSHGSDCMHGSRFLRRPVCAARLKAAIRDAAGIACISRYMRARLEELASPTGIVRLIPNGWPDEWSQRTPVAPVLSHPYVFAMGRVVALKGFQTLVQAFAQLDSLRSQVSLVIAGDGPYLQELIQLAKHLGLQPQCSAPTPGSPAGVYFPGMVHGELKRALATHATVGVCPSIRQEPLGMVVLEMLTLGVPVLASRVGGLGDLIRDGENGELFSAEDVTDLAARLKRILGQPAGRDQLAGHAASSVAHLSWRQVADDYLQLFTEVLRQYPRQGASSHRLAA